MTKENFNQLPYPYSDCAFESIESYNYENYKAYLRKYNIEYSTNECLLFCYLENLREKCDSNSSANCTDYFFENLWGDITKKFCEPNCPLKCKTTEFKYQMSYMTFPTNAYFKERNFSILNVTRDFNILKDSVLRLTVGYKTLNEKIITKTAKYAFGDLIGQIGGILGCFLGASLISLIEVIELFIKIALKIVSANETAI